VPSRRLHADPQASGAAYLRAAFAFSRSGPAHRLLLRAQPHRGMPVGAGASIIQSSTACSHGSGWTTGPGYPLCRRRDGFRELEGVASRAARRPERDPCPTSSSYGDFKDLVAGGRLRWIHINGQTGLDRFADVGEQLVHGLSLGRTALNCRNLRPVAALFCLMNHDFDFQINPLECGDFTSARRAGQPALQDYRAAFTASRSNFISFLRRSASTTTWSPGTTSPSSSFMASGSWISL
jgi:hypothetical protein